MKRVFQHLLLSLFPFIAYSADGVPVVGNAQIIEKIEPSTVAVIVYDGSGRSFAHGSGFFVDKQGHVITNRHVVESASFIQIKTASGQTYDVKAVLDDDPRSDLIKLAVDIPPDSVSSIRVMDFPPRKGDRIIVVGSKTRGTVQGVCQPDILEGEIIAVHDVPDFGPLLQISAQVEPGYSGSPVINMSGQVVGVATFTTTGEETFYYAVPGTRVAGLTANNNFSIIQWEKNRKANHPNSPSYLVSRGWELMDAGDYERALAYLEQAVSSSPLYISTYASIGYCNGMLERWDEAVQAYKKAVQVDPTDDNLYHNLGIAAMKAEKWTDAAWALEQVIQINPSADDYYMLARSYMNGNRVNKAIEVYEQAIEDYPDNEDLYVGLGLAYSEKGEIRSEIRAYTEGIKATPDNFYAYYNLGIVYMQQEEYQKAVDAFKGAVRVKPGDTSANYNMVLAYIGVGDAEAARKQLTILKNLDPAGARKLESLLE